MKPDFPIRALTPNDKEFPELLKQISSTPKTIYIRGTLPPPGMPLVAVVGTRKCTPYGQLVTEQLTADLAKQGVGIVSGLALGIDGIAHEATLAQGGYTIAVLGSGIDQKSVTPREHYNLSERILESGGALVSEYPPGSHVTPFSFQARNRIIAGLTLGTLVTEAPQKSGALITAKYAVDNDRELFIVPHPITNPQGEGGNGWIKLGATLVTSASDILKALKLEEQDSAQQETPILDANAQIIMALLGRQPLYIDTIIKESKLPSAIVTATLTMLELQRLVKNIGGLQYIKNI